MQCKSWSRWIALVPASFGAGLVTCLLVMVLGQIAAFFTFQGGYGTIQASPDSPVYQCFLWGVGLAGNIAMGAVIPQVAYRIAPTHKRAMAVAAVALMAVGLAWAFVYVLLFVGRLTDPIGVLWGVIPIGGALRIMAMFAAALISTYTAPLSPLDIDAYSAPAPELLSGSDWT